MMEASSCPFNLSAEGVSALSEEQAHKFVLDRTQKWCLLHMGIYSEIRKVHALMGKELVIAMLKCAPRCGSVLDLLHARTRP